MHPTLTVPLLKRKFLKNKKAHDIQVYHGAKFNPSSKYPTSLREVILSAFGGKPT
jgi:hypothetical protein